MTQILKLLHKMIARIEIENDCKNSILVVHSSRCVVAI